MKVNIKKISELSGYSMATVSNALNEKRGVSRETAEQILKIARECGYIKEEKISRIKLVTYRDSGEVFNDSPFFSVLLESVENECRRQGYEMTVVNLYRNSPDYDDCVRELINDSSAAILLLGTEMDDESAKVFQNTVAPLVMLDSWFDSMSFNEVLMHNEDSVFQAVTYLADLGHKKIGYIRGGMRIKNFQARAVGFYRAMEKVGLEVDPRYILDVPASISGAHERMNEILATGREMPTAFFTDNDMIALGVMQSLQKYGYTIPRDISIIGFDDINFCEVFIPNLTTVKVYQKEMGRISVDRLIHLIKNPDDVKMRIQICNKLIIRDSTAPPK